jgi:oligoendopeptidase F
MPKSADNTYVWNLTRLYDSPTDPRLEADLAAAATAVETFAAKWQPRTDYLEQPAVLREALDEYEQLYRSIGTGSRPSYYLGLSRVINQNDSELKGLEARMDKRHTELSNRLTFFDLNIGKIPTETQKRLVAAPELKPYQTWLQRRFTTSAHDLGEEATNVLKIVLPQASDSWISLVDELLAEASAKVYDGTNIRQVPFNALPELLTSQDDRVIKEASTAMNRILRKIAPVAEREINAVVTTNLRTSQLTRYDRPDAATFEHDDLDSETVDAMLAAVEQRFDLSQRFYQLKARLLGRKELAYHEKGMAYGQLPSDYSFEQAAQLVRGTLHRLHPEFATEFDQALADGHIDALPREGKEGGATCYSYLLDHPIYLFLNFTGSARDVEVLGHEFGHYLNSRYMQTKCHSLDYSLTMPMAEVASTFFEKYVLEDIAGQVDDETRLALLISRLDGEVATIFRQSAAMRFEQELYRRIEAEGYLSHQQIGQLFIHHMGQYLGSAVSLAPSVGLWWIYWGHLRRQFYNYSYSFALLVAKALQTRLAADPRYIDRFCHLLSTGRSQRPRELLQSMDLDITGTEVWEMSLDQVAASLHEAEELAKKLGKL